MATFSIGNIALRGISGCVPANIEKNVDLDILSTEEMAKFIDSTGVVERRLVTGDTITSDLCQAAAEDLLTNLAWDRSEIDILIFVSQTADYLLPVTSTILQDKLKLPKTCVAFDVPLGCSGYTYGISIISSMMKACGLKKGLLLAGDTGKFVNKKDKSSYPLFGDGASATAFEFDEKAGEMHFDLGSDGSGYEAIIVPFGGTRNIVTTEALLESEVEPGITRNSCQLVLDGMDVFSFGITQAPKTVKNLFSAFSIDAESVDYFVFHQANRMMNQMIAKKLKLPAEKVPYSLQLFGNTSSATIPLTVVSQLKDKLKAGKTNMVFCGFGVGLSWATVYLEIDDSVALNLVEYQDQVVNSELV
ncbi:MAG TPA: ketoacyl-ACP synthase III [Flavobacterium sp.]|jgi:3-oxoacyl-[acyl-carrier-protein] synthase-3